MTVRNWKTYKGWGDYKGLYTKQLSNNLRFLNSTLVERKKTLTRMNKYKPVPLIGKVKLDKNNRLTSQERIKQALRAFDKTWKKEKVQFTNRESAGIKTTVRKISILKLRIKKLQKEGKINRII